MYDKIKNNISVGVTEDEIGCGYHFVVTHEGLSWTAFRTANGFKEFIKRNNLKFKFIQGGNNHKMGGWYKYYVCISEGEIIENSFWNLDDIPQNAIKYKNLSNGSLVDCYYWNINNNTYDYRPNPNAKEVYKPLKIEEHIKYMSVNG